MPKILSQRRCGHDEMNGGILEIVVGWGCNCGMLDDGNLEWMINTWKAYGWVSLRQMTVVTSWRRNGTLEARLPPRLQVPPCSTTCKSLKQRKTESVRISQPS